jgi:protein-S-isoprenylcysteine O-methyltransferase Ste14
MTLSAQSVSVGHWLFRWRGFLPVCFVALILPALYEYHYPYGTHEGLLISWGVCIAISMIGVVIRAYTVGYAAKGTSGRNTKEGQVAETLNTTGIYSIVRNPLYLGNFFIMLGQVAFLGSAWCLVVYMLSFWLYYERIIMAEEDFLRKKFGSDYEAYALRTPAFIPNLALWTKTALPYSLKFMIRKECHGLLVMMLIYAIVGLTCDYRAHDGDFLYLKLWSLVAGITVVVYVIVNGVAKKLFK